MTNSCGLDLDLSIIGVQMTEMVEKKGVIIRIRVIFSSCQCLFGAGEYKTKRKCGL